MYECRIEIAEVPVLIRCRYQENAEFFRQYWTKKRERFVIEPSETDLEKIQMDFNRMDMAEGIPAYRRTDSFLENNAIHSLLAESMIGEDVLVIHGSALCMDGQAYIFTAKSGTGKSTHARMWREVFGNRVWMINDDKPMLRITDSGVTVHGTPWDGKHHLSRNASAQLKAIVELKQSEENNITPLQKADAFPVLWRRCYSSKHPASMVRILELEERLLNAVDFYTLSCTISPEAAEAAWRGINLGAS